MTAPALLAHTAPAFHGALGLAAAGAVGGYWWAWRRGPSSRRSTVRLSCWITGVGALVLASSPWLESAAERSFTGHMSQHLVLMVVAAPLLVVARPVHTFGCAVPAPPGPLRRRTAAAWRRCAALVAPAAFLVVLYATHLTSVYDRAIGDRFVHELEHSAYLAAAVALWAAVAGAGRASGVGRIGAVFGVIAGSALLAMVLMSAREPLIPSYERSLGAIRAVDDQRTAAAIMWVSGMGVTLPLLVVAVWRWAATEERVARRAEALHDGVRG